MELKFLGAAGTVTGSCYLLTTSRHTLLLDCGQIQGNRAEEEGNRAPLPVPLERIDAVVLSHAHIDHSGRLPLLHSQGYDGPIYTHDATRALCEIMLYDSAYLHEKDAEWENRKRRRKGLATIEPLYTRGDAERVMGQFRSLAYDERREILPGIEVRLRDAGHILGAAIVELWIEDGGERRKLVFSGDLGFRESPVMEDPAYVEDADVVLLESTYGDRNHRSLESTLEELRTIFEAADDTGGNVLIPAFAVGRTQDLLYLMTQHFDEWQLGRWRIFLDSPMAIEATSIYAAYRHLYRADLFRDGRWPRLPNFTATRTSEESMALNEIESGAIIIAGSGMCTGGRILHHLKHNVWRPECHVVIVGFQAHGTLGRKLVDKAPHIRLWQEAIKVNATVHTVGGLSAHADQSGLLEWYGRFNARPPVWLVHGEDKARAALADKLREEYGVTARRPVPNDVVDLAGGRAGAA
ncbi:MAG: MBL fold metallo-hydrolase [Gammaproteobacteria bacterium]|nr:MBL fold metallo-hydrolase [Gammaproteobacteria bacterium]